MCALTCAAADQVRLRARDAAEKLKREKYATMIGEELERESREQWMERRRMAWHDGNAAMTKAKVRYEMDVVKPWQPPSRTRGESIWQCIQWRLPLNLQGERHHLGLVALSKATATELHHAHPLWLPSGLARMQRRRR